MNHNSIKDAFLLELKALFGSMRAYVYIFVLLASEVGFTSFFNFYGGSSSLASAMRYLALPIMLAAPSLTAGVFAGKNGHARMLYSLGQTEFKLLIGRTLAVLLVGIAPIVPMLAVPAMLAAGGAVGYASSYAAVIGTMLLAASYICGLITISVIFKSIKLAYLVSYIFFAVQYVSNIIYASLTSNALPLILSCIFFSVCLSLLFYGFTQNSSLSLTVFSVLTVISCIISLAANDITLSLVRILFGFFAVNTSLGGFTDSMLFDPKAFIRLVLFALCATYLSLLVLFKRRNRSLIASLEAKLGKKQVLASAGALVLTLAVLICGVSASLFGNALVDITDNDIFTPSKTTEKLISDIDEKVTVTLTVADGSEYEELLSLLAGYTRANKNIKVKTLRDKESIYTGSLKFESEKRSYTLMRHLMVAYSESAEYYAEQTYSYYYQNGQTDLSYSEFLQYYGEYFGLSDGYRYESCINKALEYVTSDKVKTVLLASGEPDKYFSDDLLFAFMANMTEIKGVTLTQTPPEADAVILMPVKNDISVTEKTALSKYLSEGGKVMLMSSYGTTDYLSLASLCSEYGLSSTDDYVFEDDSEFFYGSPETLMPSVSGEKLNAVTSGKSLILPLCTDIKTQEKVGITLTALITSSEKSYVKTDLSKGYAFNAETDSRSERNLAISAKNGAGGELIYISSSLLLLDDLNIYTDGASRDIFFTLISDIENSSSANAYAEAKFPSAITLSIPRGLLISYALTGELLAFAILAAGIFKAYKRTNG